MAFRIIAVLSVLVVLAQGHQIPSAGQASTVGSRNSGVLSPGSGGLPAGSLGGYRPVIGSAIPQPQRPVSGSRHQGALPAAALGIGSRPRHAASPVSAIRQPQGPHGNVHQNIYRQQKPY
ncbi:uncharacterized protein LOC111069897 [Drosophila obscura]|uniref:uncharacterized protein LOC111069897 n=1 Tax=Drosophila obscura TaxID=7282 RepID=UPI001BB28EA8|nr:uncharacterized protein LOC111069897 [Drosophila obscura]